MFRDKIILITGGTGSWGHELVRQLLSYGPKELRIFSRGEMAQVTMKRELGDSKLKFIIGDIRNFDSINEAVKGVDIVFHLAALKHVPICELQPDEAIKTNIIGTQNLIKACIMNRVQKVIDVSTDKAVDALNLYGMTKAVGERLMIQANLLSEFTRFVCIRAGNVLGSNGSVVPLFMDQIKTQGVITLTDIRMTRYFITLEEAISLLFKAAILSYGGEIFVMKMPSYRIIDIAQVLIEASGVKDAKISEIGIRPGEKLQEVLVSEYESQHTFKYDEQYYVIMPSLGIERLKEKYADKHLEKVSFMRYTSSDNILGKDEAKKLLHKGKFI